MALKLIKYLFFITNNFISKQITKMQWAKQVRYLIYLYNNKSLKIN